MKLWLADASVLLAREDVDDPNHVDARRFLECNDPVSTLDLALYEVANVAVVAWRDPAAAARVRGLVEALAGDGGLIRVDVELMEAAARLATANHLTVYDAAYVAAAARSGARLVSCDVRDLVSRSLAVSPAAAAAAAE